MMTCRSCRRLFTRYLDRSLSPQEQPTVDEHLAGCASCRAELRTWQRAAATLRTSQPLPVPAGLADEVWRAVLAAPREPMFLERFLAVARRAVLVSATAVLLLWGGLLMSGTMDERGRDIQDEPSLDALDIAVSIYATEAVPHGE